MDHLLRRGLRPPLKIQAYICKEVSNEYFPQFRGSYHALKRSIERQISISRFFHSSIPRRLCSHISADLSIMFHSSNHSRSVHFLQYVSGCAPALSISHGRDGAQYVEGLMASRVPSRSTGWLSRVPLCDYSPM